MNDGEWWLAARKAAQYWQEVRNNQIGVIGKETARMAEGSRMNHAKVLTEGGHDARDKRGA